MAEEILIYKYFRVSEFLFDLLISNQLYFSNISQFNDPYDCHFSYKGIPSQEEFDEYLENFITDKSKHNFHKELFNKNPEDYIEPFLEYFKSQLSYYGICCFTELKNNFLMWSHYADSHKGVCLGFSFDELIKAFPEYDNVDYQKEPYFFNIRNISESLSKAVLTKSFDWKYENEIRFLIERNKTYHFPKSALREINFGLKCQSRQMLNLVHLTTKMDYTNCKFYKADIEQSMYSVVFKETNYNLLRPEVLQTSVYDPFKGKISFTKKKFIRDETPPKKLNFPEPSIPEEKKVQCKGSLVKDTLPSNYTSNKKHGIQIDFECNINTVYDIQHFDIQTTVTVSLNKKVIGELISLTKCELEKKLVTIKTGVLSIKSAVEATKQLFEHSNKTKKNNIPFPPISEDHMYAIVVKLMNIPNV